MRKIRYIVFGYQVSAGEIVPHPVEAELVRQVYDFYLQGKSYSEIADTMNRAGCRYSENTDKWNKNTVARILQNSKYIGDEKYPAIITSVDFQKALAIQQDKCTRKNIQTSPFVQTLKTQIYCGECGEPYHRTMDSRVGEKWNCKTQTCKTKQKITDHRLASDLTALLSRLIAAPALVEQQTPQPLPASLEITRLHHEISREIDKANCNEDSAKTLIMACAAEQYRLCEDGSAQRMSKKIKQLFECNAPMAEFDAALFSATVDRVLVYQDGTIGIRLKNNQTVRKGA